jgi:NAD(P)-dependent dehydrogenase (short-subunit alcohol dehydrogenase family)
MRLQNKAGIITGAAGGIGRATAEVFAREGAGVTLVDMRADELQQTLAAIEATGGKAMALTADVSQSEDVQRVVRAAAAHFGRIDFLVNAHGISDMQDVRIVDVPEEVFDRTIAVNLRAIFLTCKYVIPHLKAAGGGAIVNLSSGAALGGGGGTAYTASKGGVNALTRAISFQNAPDLIRCNAICPGPVDTPMLKTSLKKLGREHLPPAPGTIPRVARPEEVARLALFLVSDDGAYISGAAYTIDGGSTLH